MNLREALIIQSPSLELQRAAANEIARLDATIRHLATVHYETQAQLGNVVIALHAACDYFGELPESEPAHWDAINTLHGHIQAALNCTRKEPA